MSLLEYISAVDQLQVHGYLDAALVSDNATSTSGKISITTVSRDMSGRKVVSFIFSHD